MLDSLILTLALQQRPVLTAPASTIPAVSSADVRHREHREHCAHKAHLAYQARCRALAAERKHEREAPRRTDVVTASFTRAGTISFTGLERLWESAGGPAWAAPAAARIAECESGGDPGASNPSSGAAGVWQILGSVSPGDLYNPSVNAANAVSKFRDKGDTWAAWVCQP
jgi:hypothetical protein